tara:strand:- start:467 stop:1246 length:780 start_codon:yes stop_codon:yes gene_type:complete
MADIKIDDLDPKVPVDGDFGVLDDSQDEVLGVKQSKKFNFSTIVKKSDVVDDDTTGGSDVPSSADVAVTHGTEIDANTANIATNTSNISTNTANIATNTSDIATLQSGVLSSGALVSYAGSSIPTGFLDCDGSAVDRTTYADLFTAIGTTWGIGDGSTTFNIPDLRSAHLRGVGTSTIFTHNNSITLSQTVNDQMQGHHHSAGYNNDTGSSADAIGSGSSAAATFNGINDPETDGSNGTPRTGAETSVKARGVYFIIKI